MRKFLILGTLPLLLAITVYGFSGPYNFAAEVKDAIDYWNPATRAFAARCVQRTHGGPYNIAQICDIWDVCFRKWVYINDPPGGFFNPTPASETIEMGLRGDCDDFAVLLAAAITDIGGSTRVVFARKGSEWHAYAGVYIGVEGTDAFQGIVNYICDRYGIDAVWCSFEDDGGAWLNLDWLEPHPGGRYYEGTRELVVYPWMPGSTR